MEKAMNKFNWMKKSDGCKKAYGNHPRATLVTHPPPLINQHEFLTVLIICYPVFFMVARITLDKIKGFCLKKPKDSKNDKNSSAQHYPGQGIKGIMKWTEGWADNPPPQKKTSLEKLEYGIPDENNKEYNSMKP